MNNYIRPESQILLRSFRYGSASSPSTPPKVLVLPGGGDSPDDLSATLFGTNTRTLSFFLVILRPFHF